MNPTYPPLDTLKPVAENLWIGGVQHPDGQTPSDLRQSFAGPQLRAAVERMRAWQPERIIFAQGRWLERNGTAELRRAFRWVLGEGAAQRDAPVV